ncbi:MAG: tRNA lysidine(34) synthetase TilS [Thermodesulfobacteriota bacterium]
MTIRTHRMIPEGSAVVAGVSGGPDSVALLSILAELRPELGFRLVAAHVDHGLRPESPEDARFVRDMANRLGVEFFLHVSDVKAVAAAEGISIEEAGRRVRYRFFEKTLAEIGATIPGPRTQPTTEMPPHSLSEGPCGDQQEPRCSQSSCGWGSGGRDFFQGVPSPGNSISMILGVVVTAHHRNDVVETFLLRLFRGSSLTGLSGIPPVRGHVVRPLIEADREQILAFLAERGMPYLTDPTNLDELTDRNFVRNRIIPTIRDRFPDFGKSLARTIDLVAKEQAFLERLADELYSQTIRSAPTAAPLLGTDSQNNHGAGGHLPSIFRVSREADADAERRDSAPAGDDLPVEPARHPANAHPLRDTAATESAGPADASAAYSTGDPAGDEKTHARAAVTSGHGNGILPPVQPTNRLAATSGSRSVPEVLGDGGLGEGAFFKTTAGSRNQIRVDLPRPAWRPEAGRVGSTQTKTDTLPSPRAAELKISSRKEKESNLISKTPVPRGLSRRNAIELDVGKLRAASEVLVARVIRSVLYRLAGPDLRLTEKHVRAVMGIVCGENPSARADLPRGLHAQREYGRLLLSKDDTVSAAASFPAEDQCPQGTNRAVSAQAPAREEDRSQSGADAGLSASATAPFGENSGRFHHSLATRNVGGEANDVSPAGRAVGEVVDVSSQHPPDLREWDRKARLTARAPEPSCHSWPGEVVVHEPGSLTLAGTEITLLFRLVPADHAASEERDSLVSVRFDAESMPFPFLVRLPRPGDTFRPWGTGGTKKLKKFFSDAKIPLGQRAQIPLVVKDDQIIWITGIRRSRHAPVTDETRDVLEISVSE